jgi:hypothetical protein
MPELVNFGNLQIKKRTLQKTVKTDSMEGEREIMAGNSNRIIRH